MVFVPHPVIVDENNEPTNKKAAFIAFLILTSMGLLICIYIYYRYFN